MTNEMGHIHNQKYVHTLKKTHHTSILWYLKWNILLWRWPSRHIESAGTVHVRLQRSSKLNTLK